LKDKYYNREKRLSSLAGAVGVINDPRSLQDSLREAARILTTFLPVTSCRIMLLEKGNELLRTVGLYQKRSLDWEESSLGLVSAQSAPVHQKSIIEKRPVVIDFNQPSPAMKPKEKAMLFYSNVSAALVVPVFYGETPLGLISLGEMRSYKRWSPTSDDLNFAVAVASRMGLALEVYQLRHRLTEMEEMKPVRPGAASGEDWNRIRNEIMNSLTGIMGSSELISATCSDNMDSRMIKYLEVIQRSGQRIGTLLNRYRVPDRRRTNPAQERINRVSLPGQGRLDNYLINQ
jgi:transcriptional regulator with GAF, ATPase, and Fis domain